ncbi:tape measure protein [Brevundimonas sanguinis]|uniref:tape measure protein n=1 Tax=Brevundimonas sanguinis TaxID=3021811 RepID=UPI0024154A89|nr:tape measure protein [Brevundimonas sp. NCCP 15609]
MAEEIDRLLVRVEANAAQFEAQMKKINKALYGSQYATQQALKKIKSETAAAAPQMFKPIGDSFKREMAGLASGLAAAFTTQQVIKYADAYTSLQNRLKATGLAGEALKRVEDSLYETANRNGIAVAATAELYQRATMARDNLGASEQQLLDLVSGTSAALKVQGTSATEASGALLQLGQLLGGTNVQAQEYNSLIDQMPVLLQAVANGSDRFGGSINNLTKAVKDGKVSSREFFNAALIGLRAVETQAGSATVTVSSALQTLNNELGRFVGQTDASLSITERMAQAILVLARNLDTVRDAVTVAATVIGTTLASRAIGAGIVSFTALRAQIALTNVQLMATALQSGVAAGGITRLSVAGAAGSASMRGLSAAMAFFGGPIGLAITGLAAGVALLAVNSGRAAREAKELADEVARQAREAGLAAEQTASLKGEITATQSWAASLTGEVHKLADAHFRAAAGAKAQAIETARLRLEEANKTLSKTQEAYTRRQRNDQGRAAAPASAYVDAYGRPTGEASLTAAQRTVSSDEFRNLTGQTATVRALTENLNRMLNTPLEQFSPAGGGGGVSDGKGKKGSKASGPSPEELARQRELLSLQRQIELLRAQGNDDAARAKQRELDVLNLTKQLTDAGVSNAQEAAKAHVGAVAAAEDAARGLAILWEGNQKALDDLEAANQRSNDQLLDRLGYEAELARLRGDPVAVQAKERELWIEERINALLSLRPGLTRDAARGIAEQDRGGLDVAARDGERNYQARNMARDFVDVLASDNWAEAAGRKFRDAAFDNLEDLLATLFSGITGGQGGGNSIGSMIGSALRNLIPGFSAGTRSAPGGLSYVHKGEVLANLPKGTSVIPAHAVRAMGALTGQAQLRAMPATQPAVVKLVVDEGAMFSARVAEVSGPISVQTTVQGVATVQDQQRTANMRRRQSLVG